MSPKARKQGTQAEPRDPKDAAAARRIAISWGRRCAVHDRIRASIHAPTHDLHAAELSEDADRQKQIEVVWTLLVDLVAGEPITQGVLAAFHPKKGALVASYKARQKLLDTMRTWEDVEQQVRKKGKTRSRGPRSAWEAVRNESSHGAVHRVDVRKADLRVRSGKVPII